MNPEPADDSLVEIAMAISEGHSLEWDDLKRDLPPRDSRVADALEAISRLHATRHAHADSGPPALQRWGHLQILGALEPWGDEVRYSARDEGLGREVVLTLVGPLQGDAPRTEQMLEEARARTRVAHAGLAATYGADYAYDYVGFWSEHVNGTRLSETVRQGTTVSMDRAFDILTVMVGAVDALRGAGLGSGGVRPGQIVETAPGRPVLLTSMWRTPSVRAGNSSDAALADVSDLGALLVFVLGGGELRGTIDPSAVVARLRQQRPDVRASVWAVVERGISPDTAVRYQTPAAFLAALDAAMVDSAFSVEWIVGFAVTALVILSLLWYALPSH